MKEYLQPTRFLNFQDSAFDEFLSDVDPEIQGKELAIALYEKVRDHFLYDPYHLDIRPEGLEASKILAKRRAWCVEKAIVLASVFRKYSFPSRLGFAIVTNHIGVERLTSYLRREEIVFHGYVSVFIDGKWVKCTPAFDQRICSISNVEPLVWDGSTDSLFQAYSGNQKFMEYLHEYGEFSDVPVLLMNEEMKKYYPHLWEQEYIERSFSFRRMTL